MLGRHGYLFSRLLTERRTYLHYTKVDEVKGLIVFGTKVNPGSHDVLLVRLVVISALRIRRKAQVVISRNKNHARTSLAITTPTPLPEDSPL
jgi:hypothetical protein